MLPGGMGGLEIVVVALIALVVIGPKDLPIFLRKLGRFTAKIRGMAQEFRNSFDELARQSELDELRKEVEALRNTAARPLGPELEEHFREIGAHLNDTHTPQVYAEPAALSAPDEALAAPRPKRASKPAAAKKAAPKAAAKPRKSVAAASAGHDADAVSERMGLGPAKRTRKAKA
ncbi:MAG: twin-arginine translocase subunit TatB [Proteobacteria bacterium]|nr:twin-arginine translocase subunit TatB [Pseudomonadota bacterium]